MDGNRIAPLVVNTLSRCMPASMQTVNLLMAFQEELLTPPTKRIRLVSTARLGTQQEQLASTQHTMSGVFLLMEALTMET